VGRGAVVPTFPVSNGFGCPMAASGLADSRARISASLSFGWTPTSRLAAAWRSVSALQAAEHPCVPQPGPVQVFAVSCGIVDLAAAWRCISALQAAVHPSGPQPGPAQGFAVSCGIVDVFGFTSPIGLGFGRAPGCCTPGSCEPVYEEDIDAARDGEALHGPGLWATGVHGCL